MRPRRRPLLIAPGGPLAFPDPRTADEDGLLAVGGDLSVARLLLAYSEGIFPWYDAGLPPLWWSPHPRAIVTPERIHTSRSLRRTLRRARFEVTLNHAFRQVMWGCAEREEGTWILPEFVQAYGALHDLGHAHSIEVWQEGKLVGGLYGVQLGGLFAAESMFHRVTDASKVALVCAVRALSEAGLELFDVQFLTPHLESMGAHEIGRERYLKRLTAVRDLEVTVGDPRVLVQAEQT